MEDKRTEWNTKNSQS